MPNRVMFTSCEYNLEVTFFSRRFFAFHMWLEYMYLYVKTLFKD